MTIIESFYSGVIPAGGSNKWTVAACTELSSLLKCSDSVRLQVDGDPITSSLGLRSWPVSILKREVSGGGPLEPETVKVVSLADILKKLGLAIPARLAAAKLPETVTACVIAELDDTSFSVNSDTEAYFMHRKTKPLKIFQDLNENVPSSCWPVPLPPSSLEFSCICTHGDLLEI